MAGRNGKGKPQGKWHWNAGVFFATGGKHNNAVSSSPYFFSSQKETKKPKQNLKKKKEQNLLIDFVRELLFKVFSTSHCTSGVGVVPSLLQLYC